MNLLVESSALGFRIGWIGWMDGWDMSSFLFCINRYEIGVMDGFVGFNRFLSSIIFFPVLSKRYFGGLSYTSIKNKPPTIFLRMEFPIFFYRSIVWHGDKNSILFRVQMPNLRRCFWCLGCCQKRNIWLPRLLGENSLDRKHECSGQNFGKWLLSSGTRGCTMIGYKVGPYDPYKWGYIWSLLMAWK